MQSVSAHIIHLCMVTGNTVHLSHTRPSFDTWGSLILENSIDPYTITRFLYFFSLFYSTDKTANLIRPMTANTENIRARDAIKRKSFRNARNRTRHNHCQATLIRLTKVTIDVRDPIKRRPIEKRTLSNYAQS